MLSLLKGLNTPTNMASMKFNTSTVANLMSLIDEHKDEFNEGEYVQMCNLMKHVHTNINKQPPASVNTQSAAHTTGHVFTNIRAIMCGDNSLRTLEVLNRANACSKLSVVDKYKVLCETHTNHSIDFIKSRATNQVVKQMEERLKDVVSKRDLASMYQEAKLQRRCDKRLSIENEIRRFETMKGHLSILSPTDACRIPYTELGIRVNIL